MLMQPYVRFLNRSGVATIALLSLSANAALPSADLSILPEYACPWDEVSLHWNVLDRREIKGVAFYTDSDRLLVKVPKRRRPKGKLGGSRSFKGTLKLTMRPEWKEIRLNVCRHNMDSCGLGYGKSYNVANARWTRWYHDFVQFAHKRPPMPGAQGGQIYTLRDQATQGNGHYVVRNANRLVFSMDRRNWSTKAQFTHIQWRHDTTFPLQARPETMGIRWANLASQGGPNFVAPNTSFAYPEPLQLKDFISPMGRTIIASLEYVRPTRVYWGYQNGSNYQGPQQNNFRTLIGPNFPMMRLRVECAPEG